MRTLPVRRHRQRSLPLLVVAALTCCLSTTEAALREWTGGQKMDNRWTMPNNWLSGPPSPGDDLLFPSGAAHPQNQNDYPEATTFNSLELRGGGSGGYNIGGATIALNGGLRVENNSGQPIDHTINNGFLLNSNQSFAVQNDVGTLSLTGPINLNGKELTFDVTLSLDTAVQGLISGAGSIVKTGAGPLRVLGNNTYTGTTTLRGGTLWINGSQPASAVVLEAGTLKGIGTIGALTATGAGSPGSIVVSPGASPGSLSCGTLKLNSATTLAVELNGTTAGTTYDRLNVSGSINLGSAELEVALGFTPVIGDSFIILNNDGTDPVVGAFSGLPEGAIFYLGLYAFQISYYGGSGNDVTLTVVTPPLPSLARTWDGGAPDGNWSTAANWAGDIAPAPGDSLVFPGGVAKLQTTNNFSTGRVFGSLTFSNAYTLFGTTLALGSGIAAYPGSGLVDIWTPFRLNSNQTFSAQGGTLSLNAPTDLAGNTLTLSTDTEIQTTQQGNLIGDGSVIKTGPGFLTMGGGNGYTGLTEVREGVLRMVTGTGLGSATVGTVVSNGAILSVEAGASIQESLTLHGRLQTTGGGSQLPVTWSGSVTLAGSQAQIAPVPPLRITGLLSGSGSLTVLGSGNLILTATNNFTGPTTNAGGNLYVDGYQPQSPVYLVSGQVAGTGTVGTIQSVGFGSKALSPGGPAVTQGTLTCSNILLSSSTTFRAHLNGSSPGVGYDQLNVSGSVGLEGANLQVVLGFNPAPGSSFTIIANDGTDPIAGTFNGLPEGSTFEAGGKTFQLSYAGGSGNDVVLTLPAPRPMFVAITNTPIGHVQLQATGGLSGAEYSIWAATNLALPVLWSNLGSAVANSNGSFKFTDTNALLFPRRFYRSVSP